MDVRTTCDTYPAVLLCRGGMYPNNDPLRSSILMSDNTKHLAKKCAKDAGPCLALCVAGAAVALLAVLGHSTCSEVPVPCTFAWPLPAP